MPGSARVAPGAQRFDADLTCPIGTNWAGQFLCFFLLLLRVQLGLSVPWFPCCSAPFPPAWLWLLGFGSMSEASRLIACGGGPRYVCCVCLLGRCFGFSFASMFCC